MARDLINLSVDGVLDVETQLAMLSLPPKLQMRLMNRVGVRLRTQWRQRVRDQSDLNNSPFPPRKSRKTGKNQRQKKRMLTGLASAIQVKRLTPSSTELGWGNAKMAMIASVHNDGMVLSSGASQLRRQRTSNPLKATRLQAKRLRLLGYKRAVPSEKKKRGKTRYMRPGVAWIEANLSYDQAGLLIRLLKGDEPGPTSWKVPLPAREFFGIASQQEINDLVTYLIPQILHSPR
jgi:hypothetical protein